MIKDTLLKIKNEFPQAITEIYKDHPLASYIRSEARDTIRECSPSEFNHFTFKGSAGDGRWASDRGPWIGIFHPTTHPGPKYASHGFYPVYGFPIGVDYVTFGIGQSIQEAEEKYGAKYSSQKLKNFADEMRVLIPNYSDRFKSGSISLDESHYREGYVYYKLYDLNNLPSEDELQEDLAIMLEAYDELVKKGGRNWVEDENEADEVIYQEPRPKKQRQRCPESVDIDPNQGSQRSRKAKPNPKSPPPPRNRDYCEEAKENSKFQCDISTSHKTFRRKFDGNFYVEGHHIIPMQQFYEYEKIGKNIDHVSNIAVLCPNCHKKIHHGDDQVVSDILDEIFCIHGEDLQNNFGCDIGLLKSYYNL